MSQTCKIEVMDFLISILKDHENKLDTLITRTEGIIQDKRPPNPIHPRTPSLEITLRDWEEFRDRALEADLVCYDIVDSHFTCKAINPANVYVYREKTPEIKLEEINLNHDPYPSGKLEIGLELFARVMTRQDKGDLANITVHELDALYTKNWLSRELCIPRDNIVQGNVG